MITYLLFNIFWFYILSRFFHFFFGKSNHKTWNLFLSYALFYLINSSVHLLFHHPVLNMLTSLAGLFLLSDYYCTNYLKRLLSVALIYILSMICDILIAIAFHSYRPGMKLLPESAAAAYFLLFILELFLERFIHLQKTEKLNLIHWLALITVPLCSITVICVLIMQNSYKRNTNLFIIFSLLCMNAVIFYLYDSIQNVYLKDLKQFYMERQLLAYSRQLQLMIESRKKFYELQHDIKHHFMAISALAKKQKYMEIPDYIEKIQHHYQNHTSYRHYSDHALIDGILNYMLENTASRFKYLRIRVDIPSQIAFSNFDMSVLLGNLMDNAIKAALESEDKYLDLDMNYDKGVLILIITNSYDGNLSMHKNRLISTKTDTELPHGIGLSSVEKIVEQNNGYLNISHEMHRFTVKIVLYTNSSS